LCRAGVQGVMLKDTLAISSYFTCPSSSLP
jgi:hypothetical protein